MSELTDIDRIRKKRRLKTMLNRILLLVVLTLAGVGIYAIKDEIVTIGVTDYIQEMLVSYGSGEGYPLEFGGDQALGTYQIGSSLGVLTDSNFYIYNANGKQVRNVQHKYSNPVVKIANRRVLIYDRGGKQLRVESLTKTVAQKELQYPIYAGDISGRGEVAVAIGAQRYLAQVKVYDRAMAEDPLVFNWLSAYNYITALAFMDDDKGLVAAAVNASGGNLVSSARMFSFGQGETGVYELKDELIHSVKATPQGIWAVTDRRAVLLSKTGDALQEYDYQYQTLISFDHNSRGELALLFGDYREDKNSTITILGADGSTAGEISISSHLQEMSLSNACVTVVVDGQLLSYNFAGEEVGKRPFSGEALEMKVLGESAYIVSPETIFKLSIN